MEESSVYYTQDNEGNKPLDLMSVKQMSDSELKFFVPAYQRGYRWRKTEVRLLVDDIDKYIIEETGKDEKNECPFYCLQSIVVKKNETEQLEVIDGQQRLTTVLIVLQVLYILDEWKQFLKDYQRGDFDANSFMREHTYVMQYETRESSDNWLFGLTKAYIADTINNNQNESKKLRELNSDYYHFIEAFNETMNIMKDWDKFKRYKFEETLLKKVKFIWYNISLVDSTDKDVDIFDRINATKIDLNNAELIKALFLQGNNFGSEIHLREQYAIDWDRIEKRLQDSSLWGFMYRSNHPYKYDTHIEYVFDLLQDKKKEDMDYFHYTFNKYYEKFPLAQKDRLLYVKKCWEKVLETMLILDEWYKDRICYHYIGYLLEYGKTLEDNAPITIPYLKNHLLNVNKDKRTATLKKLIKHSLKDIKSSQLFHGASNNYVTQLLFLLNIQSEQNRKSETARFSFASYKKIKEQPGWHEEHVASNSDYIPEYSDKDKLAYTLFEYFTGIVYVENIDLDNYKKAVISAYPNDEESKKICGYIMDILKLPKKEDENNEANEENLKDRYFKIMDYFDAKGDDAFKEDIVVGRFKKREKDFIWNFALLNATTNMSYGNNIYPIKRKRIMSDEYYIYTPICTRAMFEKAYSRKLSNLMVWGRKDAKEFWDYICRCLADFLPEGFRLPFNY